MSELKARLTLKEHLEKHLGENWAKVKKLETYSPYDYSGKILTSQKEILDPGRDVTCAVLAHLGRSRYAYVFIYHHQSKKGVKVMEAKGLPKKVIVSLDRPGLSEVYKVYRKPLNLT